MLRIYSALAHIMTISSQVIANWELNEHNTIFRIKSCVL